MAGWPRLCCKFRPMKTKASNQCCHQLEFQGWSGIRLLEVVWPREADWRADSATVSNPGSAAASLNWNSLSLHAVEVSTSALAFLSVCAAKRWKALFLAWLWKDSLALGKYGSFLRIFEAIDSLSFLSTWGVSSANGWASFHPSSGWAFRWRKV